MAKTKKQKKQTVKPNETAPPCPKGQTKNSQGVCIDDPV